MTKKTVSFASMNLEEKGEVPFKFPFLDEDGNETGITFHVLSAHSRTVKAKTEKLLDQRRQAEHARAAKDQGPVPIASEIEFGRRIAAARLVGWDGLDVEFSEDLAMELCKINPPAVAQIMAASDRLSNFTQA